MPHTTIWKLEPHTLGKHKVLREYLNQWFPIMGMTNRKILFIDGFAGPGEYLDGEPGSPIIAIDSFLEHKSRNLITAEVGFVFIEENRARYEHLSSLVEQRLSHVSEKPQVYVIHGSYDRTVENILENNSEWIFSNSPAFVMIDPFGVSDTPLAVVEKILSNQKSEIYFSFMYDPINRFKGTDDFEPHLDSLFGTRAWRQYIDIEDPDLRKTCLYLLYKAQLKNIGAEHVIKFELFKQNRLEYTIFFASKHPQGSDCMKKAIWKIAPWGDYFFRSSEHDQLSLGIETPDFEPLKRQLIREFGGKGWVTIEEIELFIKSDRTPYHSAQLRKHALIPFEEQGVIEIASPRQKRNVYPKGTRIRFLTEGQ